MTPRTVTPSSDRHSGRASALDRLTPRQRLCLDLTARGLTSAAIAERLRLSPRTVDDHLAGACRTLGVRTRIQAVARLAGTLRRTKLGGQA
jgi:DNA-binding CsgD family transcriptional regulator